MMYQIRKLPIIQGIFRRSRKRVRTLLLERLMSSLFQIHILPPTTRPYGHHPLFETAYHQDVTNPSQYKDGLDSYFIGYMNNDKRDSISSYCKKPDIYGMPLLKTTPTSNTSTIFLIYTIHTKNSTNNHRAAQKSIFSIYIHGYRSDTGTQAGMCGEHCRWGCIPCRAGGRVLGQYRSDQAELKNPRAARIIWYLLTPLVNPTIVPLAYWSQYGAPNPVNAGTT